MVGAQESYQNLMRVVLRRIVAGHIVKSLDSEDDFSSGRRIVNCHQQESFSRLLSFERSHIIKFEFLICRLA